MKAIKWVVFGVKELWFKEWKNLVEESIYVIEIELEKIFLLLKSNHLFVNNYWAPAVCQEHPFWSQDYKDNSY